MPLRSEQAEYYSALSGDRVQCHLCPNECTLARGEMGLCASRVNVDGTSLILPYYGAVSSIAIDPIEKKPLAEFMPGTATYSVGFWHCTMRCPFCQNWEIAHPYTIRVRRIEPEQLVDMAVQSGCPSISFTYSEPCLHIEYVIRSMSLAKEAGLATVLVTNGNVLAEPARAILSRTDAVNVDLKAFSPQVYRKVLGGKLDTVKQFIQLAASICHIEVTSLLVPGVLDSEEAMEGIAGFIESVDPAILLHITQYRPAFRWHEEALAPAAARGLAAAAGRRHDRVRAHLWT